MTLEIIQEYTPDGMIMVTIHDGDVLAQAFVSSEHLVQGKIAQLVDLYFNQDADTNQ